MFASLSPHIEALILDMDGVLWKDNQPLVDLPHTFNHMREIGLKVVLATNNATRTIEDYQAKLASHGVQIEQEQVVISTQALIFLLRQIFPNGAPVYVIGEPGLIKMLAASGFNHSDEEPRAVITGLDRSFTYQKLNRACRLIRSGLPFYGTNPDPSFPTPTGLGPGAGSIIAAVQTASGQKPIIAGKPEPVMIQVALNRLKLSPNQALVVGDRLDTDILGGIRAGCPTALVLSGVTTLKDLEQSEIKPDLVAPDLRKLVEG